MTRALDDDEREVDHQNEDIADGDLSAVQAGMFEQCKLVRRYELRCAVASPLTPLVLLRYLSYEQTSRCLPAKLLRSEY